MSEPIDATLVEARRLIARSREELNRDEVIDVMWALADETEKLADYIGQPRKTCGVERSTAYVCERDPGHGGSHYDGLVEWTTWADEDDLRFTFSMQAVVDRIRELAPDVVAYVEQTGGGVATIYAAARSRETGDPRLWQARGEDFGRYPILAGPGTFDWQGTDHVASLDEFFIGPDTELAPAQEGPPYGPLPGEYAATRDDDVDSLARAVIEAVRQWEDDEIPHDTGVIVWPGR